MGRGTNRQTEPLPMRVAPAEAISPAEKAQRVRELLEAIENGRVTLVREPGRSIIYAPYLASDGSRICVFDDAGEFDYLEWVVFPDGVRVEYKEAPAVMSYEPPSRDQLLTVWHWDD